MIVAGFGFRTSAPEESLRDAFDLARGHRTVDAIATLADKAGSPAFRALAEALNLPVRTIDPADATAQETLTQSPATQSARGTGSVAEATALAAAGPGARLLAARAISADGMAACALSIGETE